MKSITNLKICFLTGTLNKGGAEKQLYYIIKTLCENGHKILVINFGEDGYWEIRIEGLGVKVINIKVRSRIQRLIKANRNLKGEDFSIIHSAHYHINPYAMILGLIKGITSIGSFRRDGERELYTISRVFRIPTFLFTNGFISNSKETIHKLLKINALRKKLHYLPNIVNLQTQPHIPINLYPHNFLAVNNLVSRKRIDKILKFFALYSDKNSKAELTILGSGSLKSQLIELAVNLGIAQNVFFKGTVDNIGHYYQQADVVLFASESEGTPNVILEAMSYGKVIISSNVGEVPNLISDGKTGFILDFDHIDQSNQIIEMLQNQWTRMKEAGRAAHYSISQKYSYNNLYKNMMTIYEDIL